jgi:hypothetical protein
MTILKIQQQQPLSLQIISNQSTLIKQEQSKSLILIINSH